MAGNLTRAEARARAALVTVDAYAVELDLTGGEERFGSTTLVRFRAEPGAATFVELAGARIAEVTLNGAPLDPAGYDAARGRFPLPDLAAENELRVVAECAYSRTGEGLHRFVDPVDGSVYLYTQFATADAQRVYACFDQPDLKAPFELTVLAPAGWQVVSNSTPDATDDSVDGVEGGRWHFPPTPPLPTYITAVVAGPYHVVRDEYRAADGTSIPLGLYCRASLAEHLDAGVLFDITRRGFDFFQDAFAMGYPFGKYDQILAPEFNLGAMENAGCVTVNERYLFRSRVTGALHERRAQTILHEMAHMWFGDLVTMAWWDDLWLNESFATYAGVLSQCEATEWTGAWTTFASLRKSQAYREDQLPSTHPVAADIPDIRAMEVNFDGITYHKGASVLKALAGYVGRDNFLAGVASYFRRHAWGNTTLADLLDALGEASGRPLTEWSKQWLETAGVNTLRPDFAVGADGRFTSFAVLQEAPAQHPTLRSHRIAVGLYDRGPAGIARRHRVEVDVAGARTEVPELIGARRPDLLLVNDDDLTYAKVRLDERSLDTLRSGIAELVEPMPRALAWSAAWDLTRDAELPARDYLRLVLSGIRSVTEVAVAQTVLVQARTALYRYADAAWRDTGRALLADGLHDLLLAAEPGSDLQLLYAQTFAAVAHSPAHLTLIGALLDGARTVDGLTIDVDLRWTLLRRLVVHGAAGPERIDAELARDATAAGEQGAAASRAALPTEEAKAAAWARITGGKLTNATLAATLEGFTEPEHEALLAPYVDRYFETVGGLWAAWSSGMAQRFATGAYPDWAVAEPTLTRTDAFLEREDPPGPLARLLREGRDDVARAIRARGRDATAAATEPAAGG